MPFIPAWLDELDLTSQEFRVLAHILRRQRCYASESTICDQCKISAKTFRRAVKKLVEMNLVEKVSRPGIAAEYTPDLKLKPRAKEPGACRKTGNEPRAKEPEGVGQMDPRGSGSFARGGRVKEPDKGTPIKVSPSKVTPFKVKKKAEQSSASSKARPKPGVVFAELEFPEQLDSETFRERFREWVDYRMTDAPGKAPKSWPRLFQKQLDAYAKDYSEREISDAILSSITSNWTGFFPKHQEGHIGRSAGGGSRADVERQIEEIINDPDYDPSVF